MPVAHPAAGPPLRSPRFVDRGQIRPQQAEVPTAEHPERGAGSAPECGRSGSEAVFIERRGRRAAVVVSPEQYERMLEALEDTEDIAAFDEAMAEEGPSIPWDQVKADLGWK